MAPDDDKLWKEYNIHIDLYKHYLELVLKFNIFYYAITGAILSFYFSKVQIATIRYSLIFPILMSLLFASFFFYGAKLLSKLALQL